MERIMSVEDRIRRAEERYYNTRTIDVLQEKESRDSSKVKFENKKDIKLLKKMIKQILVCLLIYVVFYLVVNNNYIFSQDFTNKAKEILAQDINFVQTYEVIKNKANEFWSKINFVINQDNEEKNSENDIKNDIENDMEDDLQNNDENIGGSLENVDVQSEQSNIENTEAVTENIDMTEPENISELSQMEQDANSVKSTVSFIKPVVGTISSRFGMRNPTTPTVPKNHTGTDISATIGTKVVSATDGTVILASSQGDYGNHLKIQIGDIIIVYAHCNKLYVNEGDIIKQGQEIAEVGETGNVTGPHLHFEIRYQNRYVDPEMILEL